jgi:intein/homing endonuclease/RecA/RadA recombinase
MKKSKKEKAVKFEGNRSKTKDKGPEKKAKKADKNVKSSKKTTDSDDEVKLSKKSKKSKVKVVDDKVADKKAKDKRSKEDSITTAKTKLLKLPELIASDSFISLSKGIDAIEDKMHCHSVYLKSTSNIKHALSTGILHYDLMLGGGLAPGKMTVEYGGEGSGKCVDGNTIIQTSNGMMPIKKLFKKSDPWGKGIRRDFFINTAVGPRKVSHIYRRMVDETVEISGGYFDKLNCTKEHPVLVVNKKTGELIYREASKVKRGDIMFVKRGGLLNTGDTISVGSYNGKEIHLDDDLAEILGIVLADGGTSRQYTINVGKRQNLKILDNLCDALGRVFGKDSYTKHIYIRNDSKGKSYEYHKITILASVTKFLRNKTLHSGYGARNKFVPACMFKSPKIIIDKFLKSYFTCDYSGQGIASKKLAVDLARLLLAVGIPSGLRKSKVRTDTGLLDYFTLNFGTFSREFHALAHFKGMVGKSREKISKNRSTRNPNGKLAYWTASDPYCWMSYAWAFDIVGEFKKPFAGANSGIYKVDGKNKRLRLGFDKNVTISQLLKYPDHISSLELVLPKLAESLNFIIQNDLIAVTVSSKKTIHERKPVYDVTVPDVHNFVANGFIVHNSSRMFTAIASAITTGTMPIVHDAEAALNSSYVDRILRYRTGYVLDDLVGEQDERGNWIRLPYMRYYQETIGQRVFRHIKRSLDLLPDVIEDRGGNFYKIWRDKSGEISRREEYDGSAQAAYFIDSAAALIPEANDDNDEAGAMAASARMFAWGFPLIKGRVSAKRVVLFFTNQVRTKPGVMGSSGVYMTGGDTFKHNNDCRSYTDQRHPKALDMPAKPGENYTREKSINGGEDKYHYQRIRNEKNKMFTPRRTALMRIRMEHDGKPGDGVCETYDCFQYLRSTGQLVKRGEGLTLNVDGTKKGGKIPDLLGANGGKLDWNKFKLLVEMPENKRMLQKHCQAQLVSGYAFQLETQAQNKGLVTSDDNDGD